MKLLKAIFNEFDIRKKSIKIHEDADCKMTKILNENQY